MAASFHSYTNLEDQIADAIRAALDKGTARIQRLETPAGQVWLKRMEHLSLRWRLQKGDPAKRFNLDRTGLHLLHDAGLPVAPILAEGSDFFVTPDVGPTLRALLTDPDVGAGERRRAFAAAGRALGLLHRKGFSHGRPALRDLCWNGREVTLIDLEQFSLRHRAPRHMALDVAIFVHSVLVDGGAAEDLDAAVSAYRKVAGPEMLARAARLGRAFGWAAPLTDRIAARKPKAREIAAVAPALRYLAAIG
jgi:tRNA A-37 threonylcarbamoyl transferase component Bud32